VCCPLTKLCVKPYEKCSPEDSSVFKDVLVPFNTFSNAWSPSTGEPTKKCSDDPNVCPTDKNKADIYQLGLWAEGVAGNFHLEVQKIYATTPSKPTGDQCSSTEYCCPDAKHCLTPTNISCAKDANACSADQTCCPLTKICVNVGKPCESPCKESDTYCCPDAKACLKPTNPGVFCKDGSDCGSSEVCCPLTKLCVKPYEKCSPGLDVSVSSPSWTNTCKKGTTQDQLRWNVSKAAADGGLPFAPGLPADEKVTDAICCDTDFKPYAEPNGFFAQPNVNLFSKLDKNGVTTFYDSSCGIPIFKAPVGRSFEAFYNDTLEHGWPSFRTGEVVKENVVTVYSTGEVISKCGTHLGSYLPDSIGSRWCIDLMCISGQKK